MSALTTPRPRALDAPAEGATTALVILGMHRSGTSALARCCNLLGVDLGTSFIPTQADNQSGFWEDARVKEADDLALAAQGLLWDDVRPLPDSWEESLGIAEVRDRLLETLASLCRRGGQFGVKDPRISRLLPLWLPLFARLDATPVFLIALRPPAEVADSLARRDRLTPARSHLLWLRYTLEAELHTRGHRRAIVPFDDLLRDWRGTLERAGRDVGIVWPLSVDEAAPAIDAFLDGRLRHHAGDDHATPTPTPAVERWTREAHALLSAMRDDDTPERRARLDRLRAGVAAADLALGPVVLELEEEIASLRSGAEPEAGESGRSARERELDRARRDLGLAHEVAREATQALAAERVAGEQLRADLARVGGALAAEVQQVRSLQQRLDAQGAELVVQRNQRALAERTFADVERSLSWRLTAPLRALAARLRGGPRRG